MYWTVAWLPYRYSSIAHPLQKTKTKTFSGILCTANGIKKMAFFSDSVMETRNNAKTSSDFNDRVRFVAI